MAGDHRESYTRSGVDAMKWGLVRAAVDRDIWLSARRTATNTCHEGSPDAGWRISFDHDPAVHERDREPGYEQPAGVSHHRLPAMPRNRTDRPDGTVYLEDHLGNLTPESVDVWGAPANSGAFEFQGLYRKWSDRVDQVFAGWDQVDHMPEETYFWEAATQLRDAVKPLTAMVYPSASYYTACRWLGLVERDPGPDSTSPPARMWAPQINGPIDRYIIPLQGTLLNLFVLGEMLAAQLDGQGKMWQNARRSVMEIGQHTTKTMSGRPNYDAELFIKSAGWVVGAMGLIALPAVASIGLAVTGLGLASADAILAEIQKHKREVIDIEAAIKIGPVDDILRATETTLNTDRDNSLDAQVQLDESDCIDLLRTAEYHLATDQAVYDPETGIYKTCFTMNVADVRTDTAPAQPRDVDINVEFERLRKAGTIFADELAEELRGIAHGVRGVCSSPAGWERPEVGGGGPTGIGIGITGPWEDWVEVRDQLAQILDTTATQVKEVGEYLVSTANFLERQDDSAREAMEKAASELDAAFT
ncbi:hypothetical protein ABTX61_08825 [Amycolatopsis japonica]|uniref:hypothetical protein n=1 Tax=Amycolatopsis japonica TaxID=208439 RepID=UPI0033294DAE